MSQLPHGVRQRYFPFSGTGETSFVAVRSLCAFLLRLNGLRATITEVFASECPGSPGMKEEKSVVREKGVVKWFNAAKGYGFIQRASGEDVFVHFSAIQMSGYRTLEEGTEVEFEVKKGPKGLQAENVNRP